MEFAFGKLALRSSTESDIDFISRLEADPENSSFITAWPGDRHVFAMHDENFLHAIVLHEGIAVGFVILSGLKNANQSIEFMRVVIADKGRGLGRTALRAVKKLCFDELKAHRLWLDVKTFNERAQNLYQSEGFVIEGTMRDCLKVGDEFQSLTLLSILEDEYRQSAK